LATTAAAALAFGFSPQLLAQGANLPPTVDAQEEFE